MAAFQTEYRRLESTDEHDELPADDQDVMLHMPESSKSKYTYMNNGVLLVMHYTIMGNQWMAKHGRVVCECFLYVLIQNISKYPILINTLDFVFINIALKVKNVGFILFRGL